LLHLSEILKALGHPIRLQIVAILCQGDEHVGALADRIGAPPAIVSQQLGILRTRDLVSRTRQNGRAVYQLAEPRLRQLIDCLEGCSVK
jgi:ArsR family transcriptional regulator